MAVALLNGVSWSFISPPFQAVDEQGHFAYVRELAETGRLPAGSHEAYTREETYALEALNYLGMRLRASTHVRVTPAQQSQIDRRLGELNHLSPPEESRNAGVANSEPPLYYALETIPYSLGWSGTLLDRLQLMRIFSALLASFTALFAFLFIRETLPSVRWACTVGALAVALTPLFGYMAGAVNPDGLLFAMASALFYCVARAFRRGLSTRLALATGAVIAVGLMTKYTFAGIVPGALLALALLARRAAREAGRQVWRAQIVTVAVLAIPVIAYIARNVLTHEPALGIAQSSLESIHGSLFALANYDWQLFLPRLPGTPNDFSGLFAPTQIWFDGYVGRLGWLDTYFPAWVYTAALIVAAPAVALCVRALVATREQLRGRWLEIVAYAAMAAGLLVLVGTASYLVFPLQTASYGQTRYLLVLLPLFGMLTALAARGAGRRWGPTVGTLMVVLFLAHDLFSQLQVIARYYS